MNIVGKDNAKISANPKTSDLTVGWNFRDENHNVKDHSIIISAESGPILVKESWEKMIEM